MTWKVREDDPHPLDAMTKKEKAIAKRQRKGQRYLIEAAHGGWNRIGKFSRDECGSFRKHRKNS